MNRSTIYVIGAVLIVVVVGFLAWRAQRTLTGNLPPAIDCRDEAEARTLAGPGAIKVLGTGSMVPFIPAALPGQDPLKTVVAYVVIEPATFDDIQPGDLCIYAAEWTTGFVIHQAAMKDGGGWIMSGLGNAHSEARWRVTPANFKGIAARVYRWPLKP